MTSEPQVKRLAGQAVELWGTSLLLESLVVLLVVSRLSKFRIIPVKGHPVGLSGEHIGHWHTIQSLQPGFLKKNLSNQSVKKVLMGPKQLTLSKSFRKILHIVCT